MINVFCPKFKALDVFTLEAEVGKLQYMEAMLQQYSFVIKGSSVFNRIFMSLSNLGGFRSLVMSVRLKSRCHFYWSVPICPIAKKNTIATDTR